MIKFLRSIFRFLRIGKIYLFFITISRFGLISILRARAAKKRYLCRILMAKPIAVTAGAAEVHMLLGHKRVYEGLWALYSLIHFCNLPFSVVVHDDGTLTKDDSLKLDKLFPGCRIISRSLADSVVMEYLSKEGLNNCIKLRQTLIFGLKLFDPLFFSKSGCLVLLDSDFLFYSAPKELIACIGKYSSDACKLNMYSLDNGYRYCLSPAEIKSLMPQSCLPRVNPGLLCVQSNVLDLHRIEKYLWHPNFWKKDGSAKYHAELTLWAMELTKSGALPFPQTYAICADPRDRDLVCGHYCGGVDTSNYFYEYGLPRLAKIFL